MSTTAVAPVIPDPVAAARKQVETSDFFALCYLMLSQLAYADEDNGQKAVQQIESSLPTMPVPQGTVAGKWSLSWGPQVTNDNSNLMYAAEFLDTASGMPIFSAVVIRGTDTQAKPSGILKEIVEDLAADQQVAFPENNQDGSKIAKGTQVGLTVLNGFQDPNTHQTVTQYLQGFVAKNPGAPIVVTGHSLGGCQTTVMALDLASKLPGAKLVPNSFAAPTAGNSAFIKLYEQTFPFCPRWFNDIDLVPMAFAGLSGIKQLWTNCGRKAPGAVKDVVSVLEFVLRHLDYTQQSASNSRELTGVCQPPGGPTASAVAPEAVAAEIRQLIENKIREIPLGGLAVHLMSFDNLIDWVKELVFQHLILTGYWNAVESTKGVAPIPNPFGASAAAAA